MFSVFVIQETARGLLHHHMLGRTFATIFSIARLADNQSWLAMIMNQLARQIPSVFLTLAMLLAPAHASETLKPLVQCPKTGPHRACLSIRFFFSEDRDPQTAPVVHGRLSGHATQSYRLQLTPHALGSVAPPEVGYLLAYRGRSARNLPIILTTRGPLEIEAGLRSAEISTNLIVIDESSGNVVGSYFSLPDTFISTGTGGATVWIKETNLCVSAPQNKPVLLTIAKHGCRASQALTAITEAGPARGARMQHWSQLLPELRTFTAGPGAEETGILQSRDSVNDYIAAYRVRNTGFLLLLKRCSDCN